MSLEKLFTGSATAKILDEVVVHYTTFMKALPLLEELVWSL